MDLAVVFRNASARGVSPLLYGVCKMMFLRRQTEKMQVEFIFFYKYIAICHNKKKVFFVPLHSIEKNKKPYLIFLFYETRHDCNFGPRQPREYRAC